MNPWLRVLSAPMFVLVGSIGTTWALYGGMSAFQMFCVLIIGASQGWLARGDLMRERPFVPGQAMSAPSRGLHFPDCRDPRCAGCGFASWHANEPSQARHAKNQGGNPG